MTKALVYPSLDSLEAVEGTCDQQRLWSDCADAQSDLSLRWSHKSFLKVFVMRRPICRSDRILDNYWQKKKEDITRSFMLIFTFWYSKTSMTRPETKIWSCRGQITVEIELICPNNNPKPDLYNINTHTKFVENPFIFTQVSPETKKQNKKTTTTTTTKKTTKNKQTKKKKKKKKKIKKNKK